MSIFNEEKDEVVKTRWKIGIGFVMFFAIMFSFFGLIDLLFQPSKEETLNSSATPSRSMELCQSLPIPSGQRLHDWNYGPRSLVTFNFKSDSDFDSFSQLYREFLTRNGWSEHQNWRGAYFKGDQRVSVSNTGNYYHVNCTSR